MDLKNSKQEDAIETPKKLSDSDLEQLLYKRNCIHVF